MKHESILPSLPEHRVPDDVVTDGKLWRLQVSGLVERPGELDAAALQALPRTDLADDFVCREGWTVPGLRWAGVALRDLLEHVGLAAGARFVRVASRGFFVTIPVDELAGRPLLLAYLLDESPLTPAHGAPLRLVAPGRDCFYAVKWVDRVEVLGETTEPDTAPTVALGRLK